MAAEPEKKSRDLFWFRLHAWVGLKLSIFMSFILITGTFAVLSHEIDWLFNPEMRAAPVDAQAVAWGAAYDELKHRHPHVDLVSLDQYPDPWFSIQAMVNTHWGSIERLWFKPADGTYKGATRWYNVQRFFRMTHRHLMLPTPIGIPIVTLLAVPLLISIVSGLFSYKKFWRGFFRRPRLGKGQRIAFGDLHRLAGLWCIWFIVLIAATSIWYFIEVMGGNAGAFPKVQDPQPRAQIIPAELDGARVQAMVDDAYQRYPGLLVRRIVFPQAHTGAVVVQGDWTAVLVRTRANSLAYDPLSGQFLGGYRGEELSIHHRISEAADPLHFGTFAGLWSKVPWFLFGVFMSFLSISGCVIYGQRAFKSVSRGRPPSQSLSA